MSDKNILVELNKAGFKQNNKWLVEGVSLKVEKGKIVTLIGPNGSGKSTTAKIALGIYKNIEGSVEKYTNKVGYVPQHGGYFNDLSLYQNLKAIAEIVINNKSKEDYKINSLISKFELENLKNVKAKFLSGGQKKKLVIALSLLSDPKVLLLDECFAALDVLTIKMLQEIIVNLQQENNITICICDHQARDLLACVDVAMILSNGRIIANDSPSNLVQDINAKNAYFGESFKIN